MDVKKVYICSVCETVHEKEYEAEECCQPEVWHMWQCPICDETYDTEQEAIECYNQCNDEELNIPVEEGSYRRYPDAIWSRSPAFYITEFERLNYLKGEE